ncbi:MAG: hypothetical protein E7578_05250 [Ruminococcaceae bacterium]|nr:hypothetical protein [Oscillospiraceae bacterium]
MTVKIFNGNDCECTYISNASMFGIKITDNNDSSIISICNVFAEEHLTKFKTNTIEKEISPGKIAKIVFYDHHELAFSRRCFEEFPGMEIINIEANGIKIIVTV